MTRSMIPRSAASAAHEQVADALAAELQARGLSVHQFCGFGASVLSVDAGAATMRVDAAAIVWRVSELGGAWDIHPVGGALDEFADRVAAAVRGR